ncbi:hypothetical protein MASR2M79_23400 [Aminivibrio sp.]
MKRWNRYEIADQRLKTVASSIDALEGMKGKLQDAVAPRRRRKERLSRSAERNPLEFRRLEVEVEVARLNQAIQRKSFRRFYEEEKI